MKTVAFDESGHSGENLLDSDQPIYTLAGVCVEEEWAAELVDGLLRERQSTELKFRHLRRRSSGRKLILETLGAAPMKPDARSLCVSEKRWFLTAKIVDLLLEPMCINSKLFYETGMHRKATEYLFAKGAEDAGAELWQCFEKTFVRTVRNPNPASLAELSTSLAEVKSAADGSMTGHILAPIPQSTDYMAGELSGSGAKDQLEPALTSLVLQLQAWSERLGEPFRVVHDDSKVIASWVDVLETMADPTVEPFSIKSDVSTFRLPLLSNQIEFAASEDSSAVQLADIVAGAAAWWLRDEVTGGADEFAIAIKQTGLRADWAVGSEQFHEMAMSRPEP